MKRVRLNSQARKAFRGSSRGFTLIEVVIAMLLLGIIGVAVLSSLSYASAVLISVDRRATAESLAKTQMESIKNQDYSIAPWAYTVTDSGRNSSDPPDWWDTGSPGNPPLLSSNYVGYSVEVSAESLYDDDHNILVDIQQITVTVSYDIVRYNTTTRGSELIQKQFTLTDYKRNPEA